MFGVRNSARVRTQLSLLITVLHCTDTFCRPKESHEDSQTYNVDSTTTTKDAYVVCNAFEGGNLQCQVVVLCHSFTPQQQWPSVSLRTFPSHAQPHFDHSIRPSSQKSPFFSVNLHSGIATCRRVTCPNCAERYHTLMSGNNLCFISRLLIPL